MAMSAAGAYVQELRKRHGLTQASVAELVSVQERQVQRWEKGEQVPKSTELMRLVAAVKGSIVHVERLMMDDRATPDDGRALAAAWIDQGVEAYLAGQGGVALEGDLRIAADIIRELERQGRIGDFIRFFRPDPS